MKINKLSAVIAAMVLAITPSCSDDDTVKTPLSEVQGELTVQTHSSLTFDWDKVDGALQYGYELLDNEDQLIVRSVTEKPTATFTGLKPGSEYTLKVWAFAAYGSEYTSSEPLVLTATTDPLKAIGKPTLNVTSYGAAYQVTWKKVSNAEGYVYSLLDSAGEVVMSANTTDRVVNLVNLEDGEYTLNVKATTTKDGYEPEGQPSTTIINIKEVFEWQAKGTYNSKLLNQSWEATIKYYGGGNYGISGWYGIPNYSILFYIDDEEELGNDYDEDDIFHVLDVYDYDDSAYAYRVPTGRPDIPDLLVYTWYNSCELIGNKLGGSVKLRVKGGDATKYVNDTFTWVGEDDEASADSFVGSWNAALSGSSYINGGDVAEPFNISETVQFTKVDDQTISMPALYFSNVTMNVKINSVDKTFTAQPLVIESKYVLAGQESENSPIVGRIKDDGTIEFTDWNVWEDGWVLLENQKAVYTKK